jgi:signal transduction histidine kinase
VRADGPDARISVRDRGIGITEEDRQRIFGRFERAVSGRNYGGLGLGLWITRQVVEALGGLGLGLWIVRQIVEAHGGEVSVESTPGQGASFLVRLPLG